MASISAHAALGARPLTLPIYVPRSGVLRNLADRNGQDLASTLSICAPDHRGGVGAGRMARIARPRSVNAEPGSAKVRQFPYVVADRMRECPRTQHPIRWWVISLADALACVQVARHETAYAIARTGPDASDSEATQIHIGCRVRAHVGDCRVAPAEHASSRPPVHLPHLRMAENGVCSHRVFQS